PYIELTNEKYPRLKVVRNVKRKKNKNHLYGPYPNVTAARKTVNIINRIYPLRKCENLKKDLCLYYHINLCLGYCKYEIEKDKIDKMKEEIISFLKGDSSSIEKRIIEEMNKASESLNYERALELKNILDDIKITLRKQKIDLNKSSNFDIINYYRENNYLSIQIFFIRDGLLSGRHQEIIQSVGETEEDLEEFIIKFYDKTGILPKDLYIPEILNNEVLSSYLNINISTPYRGKIKSLFDLAGENAKENPEKEEEIISKDEKKRKDALKELASMLNVPSIYRIESFDNSHLFGTYYVGGMVVFEDLLPNKNEYRKYKITSDAKDDLKAMHEVLYRRYYRMIMEESVKPDLILVDGGKTQIAVCKEVIESLNLDIKIAGLVKNSHHRTSSLMDENYNIIDIPEDSNLFLYLSRIQEEVHRFAITYHRNIKSKGALSSVLDMVTGIGEKRKKELLKKFGSLKKMKNATVEEFEEVLPEEIAIELYKYLKTL
ncbi:MAG: excinuclease ABC subunit C, partial [Bacilli bacterium]|nr:excinuclease ABC subunit C [Bacilli bacterium]